MADAQDTRREQIAELALRYHKAPRPDGEGEYGCPGLECPGVKRLIAFAETVAQAPAPGVGVEQHCTFSTGIGGEITAGRGRLGDDGYWEFPCTECEDRANYRLQRECEASRRITELEQALAQSQAKVVELTGYACFVHGTDIPETEAAAKAVLLKRALDAEQALAQAREERDAFKARSEEDLADSIKWAERAEAAEARLAQPEQQTS